MIKNQVKTTLLFIVLLICLKNFIYLFFSLKGSFDLRFASFNQLVFFYFTGFLAFVILIYLAYCFFFSDRLKRRELAVRGLLLFNCLLGSFIATLIWFLVSVYFDYSPIVTSFLGLEVVRVWWPSDYLTTALYDSVKATYGVQIADAVDYKNCIYKGNNNLNSSLILAIEQAEAFKVEYSPFISWLFNLVNRSDIFTWSKSFNLILSSLLPVLGWGIWCAFCNLLVFSTIKGLGTCLVYFFEKSRLSATVSESSPLFIGPRLPAPRDEYRFVSQSQVGRSVENCNNELVNIAVKQKALWLQHKQLFEAADLQKALFCELDFRLKKLETLIVQ